jgi:hypothetical protein
MRTARRPRGLRPCSEEAGPCRDESRAPGCHRDQSSHAASSDGTRRSRLLRIASMPWRQERVPVWLLWQASHEGALKSGPSPSRRPAGSPAAVHCVLKTACPRSNAVCSASVSVRQGCGGCASSCAATPNAALAASAINTDTTATPRRTRDQPDFTCVIATLTFACVPPLNCSTKSLFPDNSNCTIFCTFSQPRCTWKS